MERRLSHIALAAWILAGCSDSKFSGGTTQTVSQAAPAPAEANAEKPETPPVVSEPIEPIDIPEADRTVEFGADEVFHIGDGSIGGQSACVAEVQSYDLNGTIYFFEFEVAEDDTTLDLSIAKICGVDAEGMTNISLRNSQSSAVELSEVTVPTDKAGQTFPWSPYPTFRLDKGVYSIVITSNNTLGKSRPAASSLPNGLDEFDDFIVGGINVKADKPVRASRIYVE